MSTATTTAPPGSGRPGRTRGGRAARHRPGQRALADRLHRLQRLALIGSNGERLFLTDFRYLSQAAEQVGDGGRRTSRQNLLDAVAAKLPGDGPLRLGFDDANLSVRDHGKLAGAVRDGSSSSLPAVPWRTCGCARTPASSRRSGPPRGWPTRPSRRCSSAGWRGARSATSRSTSSSPCAAWAPQAPSFPPIVAAGAHGALPHAEPRDVAIEPGVLCVVDWGAQLDGYASDCTRTFATGESLSYWPPWHGQPKPAAAAVGIRVTRWPSFTSVFACRRRAGSPFTCTGQPRWTQRFERSVKLGPSSSRPLFRMYAVRRETSPSLGLEQERDDHVLVLGEVLDRARRRSSDGPA